MIRTAQEAGVSTGVDALGVPSADAISDYEEVVAGVEGVLAPAVGFAGVGGHVGSMG